MRKKKVTMKDIATAAGVSQPTVSIILNSSDSVKIADETRKRVLTLAEELGYQLPHSRNGSGKANKIALMVNSLNMHDPFINAINAAREEAWARGYVLVVLDYEESDTLEQALIREICSGDYSAVVYAHNMTKQMPLLQLPEQLPLVMLNCYPPHGHKLPCILPTNQNGAYQITEHLLQQGYRRIAMVSGEPWSEPAIERQQGYQQALCDYGVEFDARYMLAGNWSIHQSYLRTLALLELDPIPEAIFCASDFMAVGCYQALAQRGLRIPDDIAVASYDNQLLADELTPALTSLDLPYDDMGRLAITLVTSNELSHAQSVTEVSGELYVRASSQRLLPIEP